MIAALRRFLLAFVLFATVASVMAACALRPPGRLPWEEPLDLTRPVTGSTGRQLAALADDTPRCHALLGAAAVRFTALPPVSQGRCGYDNGVRAAGGRLVRAQWQPSDVSAACPVIAALVLWEREVVQPAAQTHLGQPVTRIDHWGTYACRNIYGRAEADLSEHARANAIDVAGFRLADGRSITVLRDWNGDPRARAFLREVRDGSCRLFSTTLSPDYNQAHADHFHFDQADRGRLGWRLCR